MRLGVSPRAWYGAFSWHLRGLFATEGLRRLGFRARDLWQPAEIEARRGLARDLATELVPELTIDRDTGYRLLASCLLPSVDEVVRIGRELISESTLADGEAAGQKKFSRFRVATSQQRLALLRVGLDRRLLALACAYFGVLPVITEADYYCSFAVDGPYTKSQLWHCDDDASDVLKLFIYCDDVGDADGPFELVDPVMSRRVRDAIGYRYAGRRYRVSDEVMDREAGPHCHVPVAGPAGTAFVVDTAHCFHRGSRIRDPQHRRIAAMVCYAPPSGQMLPRRLASGKPPLASFIPELENPIEQAVLGKPIARKWL